MHTHRAEMDRQNGEMDTSTAKATAEKSVKTAGKEKGNTDKQRRCTSTPQIQALYEQGRAIDERLTHIRTIKEERAGVAIQTAKTVTRSDRER